MHRSHPLSGLHIRWGSSLRTKLGVLFILTSLTILFVMTTTVSILLNRYSTRSYISSSENLIAQGSENIASYFTNLREASLIPYSDASIYAQIAARNPLRYEVDAHMGLALRAIASADTSVSSVYFYVHNVTTGYRLKDTGLSKAVVEEAEPVRESLDAQTLSYPYSTMSLEVSGLEDQSLVIRRILYRVPENTYMGSLEIYLNDNYLSAILQRCLNSDHERIVLKDEQGNLLYAPEGSVLDESGLAPSDLKDEAAVIKRPQGHYIYRKIELADGIRLVLIKMIPANVILTESLHILALTWSLSLLIFVLASFILVHISGQFISPISDLIEHMNRIGRGEEAEPINSTRTDEIGLLINHFQSMMNRIDELHKTRESLEISNLHHQLLALQSQLNPHFINNTIQSIGHSALQSGSTETYIHLSNFGSMMQYCMDFKNVLVPLSQEFLYIENYLSFQRMRFSDRFVFSLNLSEMASMIQVPKMLLQPLVENCFKHGHIERKGHCFILVVAQVNGSELQLTVSDNGDGCDGQKLSELNQLLERARSNEPIGDSEHIGILNTYMRMLLHFGPDSGMLCRERERGGFEVVLTLPLKGEKNEITAC